MNVLLQLYLCAPDKGGEFAVSWGWLAELSRRLGPDDRIYVVSWTLEQRTADDHGLTNVRVLHVSAVNRRLEAYTYYLWQRRAYAAARATGVHFDIVHVSSLSDFRQPGPWHRFKDCYTIFGPVGGGQSTPLALLRYDDLKVFLLREMVGRLNSADPLWRRAVKGYSKKYGVNAETVRYMPNAELLLDVTLGAGFRQLAVPERQNEKMIVLFCGRLIRKKGVYLILDIAAQMPREAPIEFQIYGRGPERAGMESRIERLGLKDRVILKGVMPYEKIGGGI